MTGIHRVVIGEEEEEEEDMTDRLIQAWETEVFPRISNRFRSSDERQSGFDQIRGALQLNMPDIAIDSIAMLYDDSGGLPESLHLPTMDDLRASANRISANEIQSGMRVRNIASEGTTQFEVPGVEKTRLLTGTVIRVDTKQSLALVEMYVGSKASLEHWWYPCNVLELAEGAVEGIAVNAECHSRFLQCESKLTRLYCRSALLMLHANDLVEMSTTQSLQLMAYESRTVPRVAQCGVHSATAATFFQTGGPSYATLQKSMGLALTKALETDAYSSLVRNLCDLVINSPQTEQDDGNTCTLEHATLAVREGKKMADLQFSSQLTDVLVSLRVKESDVCNLPDIAMDEGPWLKIYAREDCNGPRTAVYPYIGSGSPFPYYMVPSKRLHVRLRSQDLPASLEICFNGVHRDSPLLLAFMQGPLLTHENAPDALMILAVKALVKLMSGESAPFLREIYHHTLAAILRTAGPVFAADVRSAVSSLYSEVYSVPLPDSPTTAVVATYFQSVFELAMADKVNIRTHQLRNKTGQRALSPSSHVQRSKSSPVGTGGGGGGGGSRSKASNKRTKRRHDSKSPPAK